MQASALGTAAVLAILHTGAVPASAHGFSPALLELREQPDGRTIVLWKTSPTAPAGAHLEPVFAERCRPVSQPVSGESGEGMTLTWTIDCGAEGLVGSSIAIRDLETARTDALVRVALADGRTLQAVLRAAEPALEVPARASLGELLRSAGRLGFATVFDLTQLLPILALLLLARGARALAETVVAFAVGQSLTLSLGSLASLPADARTPEFALALALLALSVEIARPPNEPATFARRRPWVVGFGIGLLQGIALAVILREGAPSASESALGLASFNLGVEAGLAVLLALLGGAWLLVHARAGGVPTALRRLASLPTYAIGALAAAACFERGVGLFR